MRKQQTMEQNLPIKYTTTETMDVPDATLSYHTVPIRPSENQGENFKCLLFSRRRRGLRRQPPHCVECLFVFLLLACILCVNSIVTAADDSIPNILSVPLLSKNSNNNQSFQSSTMRRRSMQNQQTPISGSTSTTTSAATLVASSDNQRQVQEETLQQRDPLCAAYPGCIALGLEGECCPTAAGMLLDCCLITVPPLSGM
jgi:hypothetical protein